jgi:hypothetical protein
MALENLIIDRMGSEKIGSDDWKYLEYIEIWDHVRRERIKKSFIILHMCKRMRVLGCRNDWCMVFFSAFLLLLEAVENDVFTITATGFPRRRRCPCPSLLSHSPESVSEPLLFCCVNRLSRNVIGSHRLKVTYGIEIDKNF